MYRYEIKKGRSAGVYFWYTTALFPCFIEVDLRLSFPKFNSIFKGVYIGL